jgi:hypothetical protein
MGFSAYGYWTFFVCFDEYYHPSKFVTTFNDHPVYDL